MAKYSDGEYIYLVFEDDCGERFFKGWHSKNHCQKVIMDEENLFVESVKHTYAFWGVCQNEMGDPQQFLMERNTPGRGRFRVTIAQTNGELYEHFKECVDCGGDGYHFDPDSTTLPSCLSCDGQGFPPQELQKILGNQNQSKG